MVITKSSFASTSFGFSATVGQRTWTRTERARFSLAACQRCQREASFFHVCACQTVVRLVHPRGEQELASHHLEFHLIGVYRTDHG